MKRLRLSKLIRGDVILTTTTAAVSKAIRAGTQSDISHAMVCVQHGSVIDATDEGVHARNLQRLFLDEECAVHVLRLKGRITDEQAHAVCQFVRQQVGSEYSVREALKTALGGSAEWTRKQFCSRLVAQAYASAGIKLVDDPNYCSPADLTKSSLLVVVPDVTESVTDEEVARWNKHNDTTKKMREATNELLKGVRKRDKSIQTMEDVIAYLIQHPEDDKYVDGLLASSGYLTVWQAEMEKNPWQYDGRLLGGLPRKQCQEYCSTTVKDEEAGPNRYLINRGQCAALAKYYGLSSFRTLLDLHDLLAALHRQRIVVARRWLESNGLIAPMVPVVLVPHSPEWFDTLQLWDPPKAAQARAMVDHAGKDDVCSICADEPSFVCRLAEGFRPAGGPDTLRLCEDCLEIRRASGDPFV